MSRYVKELENGRSLAYGFDNVIGYYLDVFDAPDPLNPYEDVLLVEESSLLTNISNGKMIELMEEYNLPKSHIERVAMDLAF